MSSLISFVCVISVWIASTFISLLPLYLLSTVNLLSNKAAIAVGSITPVFFVFIFPVVAGILSMFFRGAIVAGRFPRKVSHPVYFRRKIYGTLWSSVYYFKPAYYVSTLIKPMKYLVFRLFGYKGSMNFTTYPDSWLRDLPLLKFGNNTYIANRCTLGTNLCFIDGVILVDGITTGSDVMIGHLSMIGLGCEFKNSVEVGLAAVIGFYNKFDDHVKIGPHCAINHRCEFAEGVTIGARSYVGENVKIKKGIKIPAGSNIPKNTIISSQEEALSYYSSETQLISDYKLEVESLFKRVS